MLIFIYLCYFYLLGNSWTAIARQLEVYMWKMGELDSKERNDHTLLLPHTMICHSRTSLC